MEKIKSIQKKLSAVQSSISPAIKQIDSLERELEVAKEEIENEIMLVPVNASFVELCKINGAEYVFVDVENIDSKRRLFEDDGTLHVVQGKIRGCFICNQDISRSEWNTEARKVCKALGVKFTELNRY